MLWSDYPLNLGFHTVWNYCNETQYWSLKRYGNRPKVGLSRFDLSNLTAGFDECDGVVVGSTTVQEICQEFATCLKQFRKRRLNWRASSCKSAKYSLGWVLSERAPPSTRTANSASTGSASAYGSCTDCRSTNYPPEASMRIHADAGTSISRSRFKSRKSAYRTAQRRSGSIPDSRRWRRTATVRHSTCRAAIGNQHGEAIHKRTSALVSKHAAIFVGNVNAKALGKTSMAKSVHDAAWTTFRTQLKYKAIQAVHGVRGSQRSVFNPNLFVLRHSIRLAAERYRRT
jgi:putative transposase